MYKRNDIAENKDLILQWIAEERPKSYMAEQLHCKIETITRWLKWLDIDYAGQQNKKGQHKGTNVYIPSSYYTNEEAPHQIAANVLRQKLIRDGVKEDHCEICGRSEWNNEKLPLELHHKDGNHHNNRLSNLIILCPNCHAVIHAKEQEK